MSPTTSSISYSQEESQQKKEGKEIVTSKEFLNFNWYFYRAETPSHLYEMAGKPLKSAPIINDGDQSGITIYLPFIKHVTTSEEAGVVKDGGKEEEL